MQGGEGVPGNDIDIAVIVSEKREGDREKLQDIAGDIFLDRGVQFSPRVFEQDEFEEKAEEGYSFYENVAHDGVVV